ncbi:MAG: trypsin-like peptidase domain-containing protein, partial [Actinobacteria bacterium]|nr:trypsin-like peptidase domain-containing protein [Actinomycetota bacterium]
YPAKLIGADKNTDIAVVKIEANNLKPANFTTIKNIKVGQLAIALGSPFGLQETVTQGVVSAIGRDVAVSADSLPMVDLIQTDAAINPGNSGGPLVNSSGQVMGINTMIFSTSGTNAGIGFAIPSDTALNIANQIMKYGKARIPFIGIQMGANTTNVKGVYVKSVVAGEPAEKAGIKQGDIIIEFDNEKIETPYQLLAGILRHNVGDNVNIKVSRNGKILDFNLTLAESK